ERDLLSHPRAELRQALAVCRGQVERGQQLFDAPPEGLLVEPVDSRGEGQKLVGVKMVEERQSLWHHAYAPFQLDRIRCEPLAEQIDRARGRINQPRQAGDGGALARAVRA